MLLMLSSDWSVVLILSSDWSVVLILSSDWSGRSGPACAGPGSGGGRVWSCPAWPGSGTTTGTWTPPSTGSSSRWAAGPTPWTSPPSTTPGSVLAYHLLSSLIILSSYHLIYARKGFTSCVRRRRWIRHRRYVATNSWSLVAGCPVPGQVTANQTPVWD